MNRINLGKFTVVEEDVGATTVDAFDVHTELHDDLEILVLRLRVPHTNFDFFIGSLDHLETILHLLFQNSVR